MYIQGKFLMDFAMCLQPGVMLAVKDASGALQFSADFHRVHELISAGQVAAKATSNRIKYLILKVPLAETVVKKTQERAGTGCVAQDSRTIHSGADITALVYSHDFKACASYGGAMRSLVPATHGVRPLSKITHDHLAAAYADCGRGIS